MNAKVQRMVGTFKRDTFHWSTRLIMHVAIGNVTVLLAEKHIVFSALFYLGFLKYEENEDKHLRDMAFIDIAGSLIGLAGHILFELYLEDIVRWEIWC